MKNNNRYTPSGFREFYSVGIDFTVIRSLYLFTICLLLISISSCNEERPVCGDDFVTGQMTMNINSSEWEGGAYTLETSILAVAGVYYYKPSCRLEQSLSFNLPSKQGVFTFSNEIDSVQNKAVATFYYLDEDLLLGRYGLPEGKENGIFDAQYDSVSRTITANFSVTLYLLQNHELPVEHLDSLVIENGYVKAIF